MTKAIKETDGMSLVAAPSARNLVLSSGGIIADNFVTCKGGQATLLLNDVQCDILYSFKLVDGRPEPYFNATDFLSSYNDSFGEKKRLDKFWNRERTKELVNLIHPKKGYKNLAKYVEGEGRFKKTFIHKDLYLSLLIWLDAKYELAITQLVEMISRNGEITYHNREMLKHDTKIKNDAVRVLEEKIKLEHPTSKTAQFIYPNIQRGINRAITGIWSKIDRNKLTAEQLLAIDELELEVERIIIAHIDTTDALEINEIVKSFLNRQVRWSA